MASTVLIANGYRRTQIADVAKALGVAKGTVYLYVESKEALLDLALRACEPDWEAPGELPLATPEPGATAAYVAARLARDGKMPLLAEAAGRDAASNVRAELEAIVGEIYDVLLRNRVPLKIIDRCAPDRADLAEVFYGVARSGLPVLLQQYIQRRVAEGHFRALPDTLVAARAVIEIAAFWAIHHAYDPSPSAVEPSLVRETVIQFAAGGLLA